MADGVRAAAPLNIVEYQALARRLADMDTCDAPLAGETIARLVADWERQAARIAALEAALEAALGDA